MIPATVAAAVSLAGFAAVRLAVAGWRSAPARARLAPPAPPSVGGPATAPAWVERRLDRCGLDHDPAQVWLALRVAPLLGAAAGLALGGAGLAVVAAAAAVAAPLVAASVWADRGDQRRAAAVAPLLERVAAGLRSGAGLAAAVREAAVHAPPALAADLAPVATALAAHQPLAPTLDGWTQRRPLPEVRLAVTALQLAAAAGGSSARAVDGVAATIRARRAAADEARALGTQARLSAGIIGVAPVAFAVLASAADPRTARFLLGSPLGLVLLTTGLLLDGVGCWWMARITARVG